MLGILVCASHSKFKTRVEFSVLPEAPLIAGWKISTNGSEKRKRSNLIICLHGKTTAEREDTLHLDDTFLSSLKVYSMNRLVLLWRLLGFFIFTFYLQPFSRLRRAQCFLFFFQAQYEPSTIVFMKKFGFTFLFSMVFFFSNPNCEIEPPSSASMSRFYWFKSGKFRWLLTWLMQGVAVQEMKWKRPKTREKEKDRQAEKKRRKTPQD